MTAPGTKLRKKDLEILLERVPSHPRPKAELEQYATPAPVAADLIHRALAKGDIAGMRVLDLGTGTGVLAIASALAGAGEVIAWEVDAEAVKTAEAAARNLGVAVRFHVGDVREADVPADTVVMNPPFGAQTPGADRPFLDRAMALADVVYTLHHEGAALIVEKAATARGFRVTERWTYAYPLKHQFLFQGKALKRIPVVGLRLARQDSS